MYTKKDICAVIILYNGENIVNENIASLYKQVEHIVLIDNSSDKFHKNIVNDCWNNSVNITCFHHKRNRGLAIRLNEALRFAVDNNYRLLLTMDQDTVLAEDCVKYLLKALNENEKCASVGPSRGEFKGKIKKKDYLITSGNLIVVKRAYESGGFMNELFIDEVDIDFSYALRKTGYTLLMVRDAHMQHKVGEYEINGVFGIKHTYLTHGIKRFYYIYRNRIIVLKKYFRLFPIACIKGIILTIKDMVCICTEKDALKKYHQVKNGILAGLKYKVQ